MNKYRYTKLGQFMYNFMNKSALFLNKHKCLYYLLACTWGFITTFLGLILTIIMFILGKKPKKWKNIYYFEIGQTWGGLEMGLMFIRDKTSDNTMNSHEYGHTFQNCILGPFFIILVAIPSAIRYWYQRIRSYKNLSNKPYDGIWFEGSATNIGFELCFSNYLN